MLRLHLQTPQLFLFLTFYLVFLASRFSCFHHGQRWLQVPGYGVRRREVAKWSYREEERGRLGGISCCRHRKGGAARSPWTSGTPWLLTDSLKKRKLLWWNQVRFVCFRSIFTTRSGCCTVTWSHVTLSSRATFRASRSATLVCLCSWMRTWKVMIQESRWCFWLPEGDSGDIGCVDSRFLSDRGIGW